MLKEKITDFLKQGLVMQIACASDSQPWVCSVYYVIDKDLSIYWLSWPSRRHSRELFNNPRAAITVALKHDLPVIGVQGEGRVSVVKSPRVVKQVMRDYVHKYDSGKLFYERFVQGVNDHQLYKFTPKRFVLLDEVNSPNSDPQELEMKEYENL
jgi:uncharacterized protein YhbP (UPF0306 family)